jgi:Catalase
MVFPRKLNSKSQPFHVKLSKTSSLLTTAGLALLALSLPIAASATMNADGEDIPAGEAQATQIVVSGIKATVAENAQKTGHAVRDAHPKAHGCVKAEFAVRQDLPADLSFGLFAQPRTYDAVIRFSNGSSTPQDDHVGDGRGMAIKVLNVDGPKILTEEPDARTQDFLMINHPIFFVRNAIDYVDFQRAATAGTVDLGLWVMKHIFHEGKIALDIKRKPVSNVLNQRYWSMVPSKIGPRQMKFSAVPCNAQLLQDVSDSPNRLRDNLEGNLAQGDACFDFRVQLRTNPATQPIEDATIEWNESEAPFVTVARITIPKQAPVQGEACEVLSYTPWHSTPDLRPLGGIQRVRKTVYSEISKLRHGLNGQERKEP